MVLFTAAARRPARVILIVIDTLRRDHISAYRGFQSTPNIDSLARRGQLFTHLMASFHHTSTSMAALFTGRTPSLETEDPRSALPWSGGTRCGLARFAPAGGASCVPETLPTLAGRLREAGYWTIGVTSNAALYEPAGFGRGFDDWVEVGDQRLDLKSPDAPSGERRSRGRWARNPAKSRRALPVNRAVIKALNRRGSDRFFLYVHYMDVHDYTFEEVVYSEAVATVDRAVGRLLGNLEGAGLLEKAVVILTSDHGERLGERHAVAGRPGHFGNPSFQELLELPLIIAPPVVEDASIPLRTQDLHYLIQEIAGLHPEPVHHLAEGELFIAESEFRTYLDGRWKSTIRRSDERQFLFDLEADPGEGRDVAEANPEVATAHLRRIDELSREFSASSGPAEGELSEREREILEVLGYLR
jgi:arylsulfatase A-like enzyme